MKAQANKLFLSYLWWILEPLLFVSLFYFVFGILMKRGGGENFILFLLVGKIVFMWFSKGVIMGSTSLLQNKGIITVRPIPKWIYPVVSVQVATYKSMIAMTLFVLILLMTGHSTPSNWWQLIPLMILTYFLISSLACFLSILVAIAEDFSQIISLFMIGMLFSSGVFWDINSIANRQKAELLLQLNPLAGLIDSYRTVILHNGLLDPARLYPALIVGALMWTINVVILKRFNNNITRLIIS